jgi:hypothetical protein
MTTGLPNQPTIRSIVLGIALLIIAILAFVRIPDIVKYAGTALMYVPAKLGIIEMVMPQDVIPLPIAKNPSSITFPSPGQYALYTNNYNLLVIHDAIIASESEPWAKIQSEELDAQVELTMIERGLAWYDTPFARGRPIFTFTVDQPGTYEFIHPARPDNMYLVPDVITGKEFFIGFVVFMEVVIVVGAVLFARRRQITTRRQKRKETLEQNRERVEQTWTKIKERQAKSGEKPSRWKKP